MRVGFYFGDIFSPNVGGGFTFQNDLINGLKCVDSDHELFIYYSSEKNDFYDSGKVKFINLKNENKIITTTTIEIEKSLFGRKKREKDLLEIVHLSFKEIAERDRLEFIFFSSTCYEPTGLPFAFLIWDLGHKVIPFFPEMSIIGWTFELREEVYRDLSRAFCVITGNDEGKRQLENFYHIAPSRIKIIPFFTPTWVNGVSRENTKISSSFCLKRKKYLFYPAQFWPHKNHIRILKALRKLKDESSNLQAVFTGYNAGSEKYVKDYAQKLSLENDVKFLGFVEQEELAFLYENAFCLTYASFLGPNNLPPLEAMTFECPVIAAKNIGMEMQLFDAALYFDPLDADDLAEKIRLLYDEQLRLSIIKKR